MDILKLTLIGSSALLMHSDRLSNPLDPMTKAHKVLTSKKKKTDEDHELIARSEWRGSLYWSDSVGVYLPTANIRSAIVEGARLSKLGKSIQRGTLILGDKAPLVYKGPRDPDTLWSSGLYYDCRSVVVGGKRIMRYRPMFQNWRVDVDITYDPGIIDAADLFQCARTAGTLIGIGDFRPNKGGPFGRFDAEQRA